MSICNPMISIICPSYNHEDYVTCFIQSILNQTIQNFELIIIDDCSVDNNLAKIKLFKDPRIKVIEHDYNHGVNYSITEGIKMAKSDIVATIASDDIASKNYLEEIIKIFKTNPKVGVIYTSLECIDEKNHHIKGAERIFNSKLSRYEILQRSFIGENQLPSPGMAFKKVAVEKYLPLPFGLLQYSDWDLHNKLLIDNEIYITEKTLLKYRITTNSLSARSDLVIARERLETDLMMDFFISITDLDLFKKIFQGMYEKFGNPVRQTIPYFLARMALESTIQNKKEWGYKTLIKFISRDCNLQLLQDLYLVDYKSIMQLCPKSNTTECSTIVDNREILRFEKKYKKYKRLSNFLLVFLTLILIIGAM